MKRRGLPSPDDWDALVLAFADPRPFPGKGLYEWYRQEAEKLTAETARESAGDEPARDLVRILVPEGIGGVVTLSGARIIVGADRVIAVSPEDAAPLERQGWPRVAEAAA